MHIVVTCRIHQSISCYTTDNQLAPVCLTAPSITSYAAQAKPKQPSWFQTKAHCEATRLSNICWPDISRTGISSVFCLCRLRCTDHPDEKQFYMGGWIKGTPVFQLSLWLLAIWSDANLKRASANIRKKNSVKQKWVASFNSLAVSLLRCSLRRLFLAHWLSHINGTVTFVLSKPRLCSIISPLPLLFSFMFLDVGSALKQSIIFVLMIYYL